MDVVKWGGVGEDMSPSVEGAEASEVNFLRARIEGNCNKREDGSGWRRGECIDGYADRCTAENDLWILLFFPEKERCYQQKIRYKFCAERTLGFRKWNLVMSHSVSHPLLSFLCCFTDQYLADIWLQISDTSAAEQWKDNTLRTREAPTPLTHLSESLSKIWKLLHLSLPLWVPFLF